MGLSNNIIALLNFFAFLASLPVTGAGIWLASNHNTACLHPFRWPLLLLGLFLLIVSLSGFVGAYWNRQGLLALYLFAMALLILLLLALLVFAFVVSRPDGSYAPDPARPSFTDYRLAGYHPWLRRYVSSSSHWTQIRRCLAQSSDVCPKLANQLLSPDQFFLNTHLSPLQV